VAGGSNDLWVRIYDFESGKELGWYLFPLKKFLNKWI
jgi:hypothetical protein